ncbi:MAG: hypothetical protein ABR583_14605 [Gaiellaceae bacterium]
MDRLRSRPVLLRIALVLIVLLWLAGPEGLRSAVPIWVPFLIALGLEVQFFLGASRRRGERTTRDRAPQAVDREELGYGGSSDELLLVRREGEEVWLPYSGETEEEIDELVVEREALASTPYIPERRPLASVRRLLAGVGLIAVLAGAAWYVENERGWNGLSADTRARATERFSAEAARVARKPVEIRCDDAGERVGVVQHADGVAQVGGGVAYLTPERCYDLYRLAFEGAISFSRTARAIAVLAHETWHLAGVSNEGTTECYALQSGVQLGRRLGLRAETARRMMRQQLVENARRGGSATEYRVTSDCRDGGELDLNPQSSDFP